MILLCHLLFGAAVASLIKNPLGAVFFAFLSHYFLDFFPHIEYSVENIFQKRWKDSLPDFLKVFLDLSIGFSLIFIFSAKTPIVFIAAFFAVLPDILTVLNIAMPNKLLTLHDFFHREKIHILGNKKFSIFWRIQNQIVAILISVILIRL